MSDDEMKDDLDEIEPDLDPKKIALGGVEDDVEDDEDFDPEDLGLTDVDDL